jgi:predicted kinase
MTTIFVFFGMIASGKSSLAEAFARRYGYPYYNTDRVRKELAGMEAATRQQEEYGRGIYTPEFSHRTYLELLERAIEDVAAGREGVVLDGSYHSPGEQEKVRRLAEEKGARCVFILCWCGDEEVQRRLAIREKDHQAVSDGRWEIYQQQKQDFEVAEELQPCLLIRLQTEKPVAQLLEDLAGRLSMQS